MKGDIFLVKLGSGKIVPALCLKVYSQYYLFCQIRSASREDIANYHNSKRNDKPIYKKTNKNHINRKKENELIYIAQPNGLKSESVVIISKQLKVDTGNILKRIAQVNEKIVLECLNLLKKVDRKNRLHQELHLLKSKIKYAQFNNEKYTDYERRVDEIISELGFQVKKPEIKKDYHNYREVPNKGFIKIYLGGR
jgi:hypothetical protein